MRASAVQKPPFPILVGIVLLLGSETVLACSCGRVSLETRYETAHSVFTAIIVDEYEEPTDQRRPIRSLYVVSESFKGSPSFAAFVSHPDDNTCGIDLDVGVEYLFFAGETGGIGLCSGVRAAAQADTELAAIRSYVRADAKDLGQPWLFVSSDSGCGLFTSFEVEYSYDSPRGLMTRHLPGEIRFSHTKSTFARDANVSAIMTELSVRTPLPFGERSDSASETMTILSGEFETSAKWTKEQTREVVWDDGTTREVSLPDSYLRRGNEVVDVLNQLRLGNTLRLYVDAEVVGPNLDISLSNTNIGDAAAQMWICINGL